MYAEMKRQDEAALQALRDELNSSEAEVFDSYFVAFRLWVLTPVFGISFASYDTD